MTGMTRKRIANVAGYIPGSFYKRELPCILSLLSDINETVDTIIVDGYVSLGSRPGLGQHIKDEIEPRVAVIGVAKNYFKGRYNRVAGGS